MAIYTPLTREDIAAYLSSFALAELDGFQGISEGVTNTNYLLHVGGERHILTLFEKHYVLEELPYFIHLMEWWNARGITCPKPIATKDGRYLTALKDKPALLVSFLEGKQARSITADHMAALGETMARMHIAGQGFPHTRANALSIAGWRMLTKKIDARADEVEQGLAAMISEELNFLEDHWPSGLPSGPIHGDLFPDNVFFAASKRPEISGIIDVYFACNDAWAYDLAIAINAWCFNYKNRFQPELMKALLQGYYEVRSLTDEEEAAMPTLLRGAALRFLLTRTHDTLFPDEGAELTLKDPQEYISKLTHWQGGA